MNKCVDQREVSGARKVPADFLDAETEQALARAWREDGDESALHRLVTSHRFLANAMARRMRRSNVPHEDLVQQANLGLLRAAESFDAERGLRFSTYASWWVRTFIQDYLMRNWSMVRIGTSAAQKSLFSNFRRLKARLEHEAYSRGETLDPVDLHAAIVRELGIPADKVETMVARMAQPDTSLNATQSGEDGARERIDLLVDDAPTPEDAVLAGLERTRVREIIAKALATLPDRERRIVIETMMRDDPPTLEQLGAVHGVSRERIRQLREQGLKRLRHVLQNEQADLTDHLPKPGGQAGTGKVHTGSGRSEGRKR